jgi:hypothetical protein
LLPSRLASSRPQPQHPPLLAQTDDLPPLQSGLQRRLPDLGQFGPNADPGQASASMKSAPVDCRLPEIDEKGKRVRDTQRRRTNRLPRALPAPNSILFYLEVVASSIGSTYLCSSVYVCCRRVLVDGRLCIRRHVDDCNVEGIVPYPFWYNSTGGLDRSAERPVCGKTGLRKDQSAERLVCAQTRLRISRASMKTGGSGPDDDDGYDCPPQRSLSFRCSEPGGDNRRRPLLTTRNGGGDRGLDRKSVV